MTRKICVVIQNRANYARIKSFLRAAQDSQNLELMTIVCSSMLLDRFGGAIEVMKSDGFIPDRAVYSAVEGNRPISMAKSTGLLVLELASLFESLQPDVVLTVADRYETIATAVAASYLNIPLAHTQGGEVSGSIDESVRHAVTKLSHLHFPATARARDFLIRMGEDPTKVFLTGCPAIDLVASTDLTLDRKFFQQTSGVGDDIDPSKPYLLAMLHPVTTEFGRGGKQIEEFVSAMREIIKQNIQVVWLWPNIDSGSETISAAMRRFRELENPTALRFYKNFSPEDYLRVLHGSSCFVGNSSSGIRESAFLGLPVVNVGGRQRNRERAENVRDVEFEAKTITKAIFEQIKHGRYPSSNLFGDGTAGVQMANIISTVDLNIEKSLNYLSGGEV